MIVYKKEKVFGVMPASYTQTEIEPKHTGKFFMSVKADSIHEIIPDFSGDETYAFEVYQDGQKHLVTGVRGERDGDEIVFYKEGF